MHLQTFHRTDGATLQPMVHRLEYRGKLEPAGRAAILALPFSVRTVEPRHFIVRERDRATHSCVLLQGFAIRSKVVAAGARQILSIHMRGEVVDLQNSLLKIADHSVEMLTAGKIAMIPRESIRTLALEHPLVCSALWVDTLVDASITREWLANVGRRDARTRIAHLFCEFALRLESTRLGEEYGYELPMTQEQIADATGLTSVHVNRTIRALERDGLIDRRHPRSIHIDNWRKLAEAGDFDSGYLHLNADDLALQ